MLLIHFVRLGQTLLTWVRAQEGDGADWRDPVRHGPHPRGREEGRDQPRQRPLHR